MINLDLNNDDMKVLRNSIHSMIETNADFFSSADSSEFVEVSQQLYVLAKLRFALDQKIAENNTEKSA